MNNKDDLCEWVRKNGKADTEEDAKNTAWAIYNLGLDHGLEIAAEWKEHFEAAVKELNELKGKN